MKILLSIISIALATCASATESGLNRVYWNNTDFKEAPAGKDIVKSSEMVSWSDPKQNKDWGDRYSMTVTGYLVPSVSGEYTFYVSGNDKGQLKLSTSEKPEDLKLMAYHIRATPYQNYTKYPTQKSQPVKLEKGKKYYLEYCAIEYTKGDFFSFAWSTPEQPTPTIISAENLKTAK